MPGPTRAFGRGMKSGRMGIDIYRHSNRDPFLALPQGIRPHSSSAVAPNPLFLLFPTIPSSAYLPFLLLFLSSDHCVATLSVIPAPSSSACFVSSILHPREAALDMKHFCSFKCSGITWS